MALIKCKECGNEVSDTAPTCPKCGARIARTPIGCGSAIGIVILALVIGISADSIFRSNTSRPASSSSPADIARQRQQAEASAAKWECRGFVEKSLVAPTTAKFPDYSTFYAGDVGDSVYVVTGFVDSQNSFGAMIRTHFECITRKDQSGNWTLQALKRVPR